MNKIRIGVTERGDGGLHIGEVCHVLAKGGWDGAILITKAPHLLVDRLDELDNLMSDAYIIHSTITGYGGTAIEPNVEPTDVTLEAYRTISERLGPDRSILRIDPIIPTITGRIEPVRVAGEALGRVRISFIDCYPHVKQRFADIGMPLPSDWRFHAPNGARFETYNEIQDAAGVKPEICAEPDFTCTGCVSLLDLDSMGVDCATNGGRGSQRPLCACIIGKTEILSHRGQCAHGCLYCYWR